MVELPVFTERDWESHIGRWSELEQREALIKLEKGAVLHSLRQSFGSEAVAKFAWEVGEGSVSNLNEYARVYRRLAGLDEEEREWVLDALSNGTLMYGHLREVHRRTKGDDKRLLSWLTRALDEDWRIRRLMEEMHLERKRERHDEAPLVEETHEPFGVAGWESGYTVMEVDPVTGKEEPWTPNASSPEATTYGTLTVLPGAMRKMEDMELTRIAISVRDVCELLSEREDPSPGDLETVRGMMRSLSGLEKELRGILEQREASGALEGEKVRPEVAER